MEQLAKGDPETWNEAFRCLYPVAFEAARSRLGESLATECEDVAIESLSEMMEKGAPVNSDDELKPFVASIARNKATDQLRRHLADKRGGKKTQSLDALLESGEAGYAGLPTEEFLDSLSEQELGRLLMDLSAEVKKEYRVVLRDHFFDQLSYNEIAAKRKISVGSVGVYLQRGLASLRNVIARRPQLKNELLAMVSDTGMVRVLLPLVTAIQLGGWFFDYMIRYQPLKIDESRLSDLERLQMTPEPQVEYGLGERPRSVLFEKLKLKYPQQFEQWQYRQEEMRRRDENIRRRWEFEKRRNRIITIFVLAGLLVGLFYGIIRLLHRLFGG